MNPPQAFTPRVPVATPGLGETLLRPREPLVRQHDTSGEVEVRRDFSSFSSWRRRSAPGRAQTPFPTDLMNEGVMRLRALALLYAFTFLMADFVPQLLFDRQVLFDNPIKWVPGAISIAVALAVVGVLQKARLEYRVVMVNRRSWSEARAACPSEREGRRHELIR
jgi:hypothetical protein